jgi:hypothetical protein
MSVAPHETIAIIASQLQSVSPAVIQMILLQILSPTVIPMSLLQSVSPAVFQ